MISGERCDDQSTWDDYVLEYEGHPLQLWGWGEVKAAHGWRAERILVKDGTTTIGGAQILIRKLPGPFRCLAYIPRGPVASQQSREVVLDALATYAKEAYQPVVLTIEPDWKALTVAKPWRHSRNTILIPRTLILDLHKSEDDLLAPMSKKTRQYIRKSSAEDVNIRRVTTEAEILECLEIYKETARRAQFAIHGDDYYLDIFRQLGEASPVFAVFYQGRIVAFLWLAISQSVAFELYGGVDEEGQQLRANYALKWHAIQIMKKWGIERYDMNGLLNDGVSTFKQGFADHEDVLVGTYDRPLSPLYPLWDKALPKAKHLLRALKNRR